MKTTITGNAAFASTTLHPNAWIVKNNRKSNSMSNDRGRLKIFPNNTVYLENDEEFELEIHNPLSMSVLCIIKIQNNLISKNGLVIRPGERVYLDCFIDTKKRFKYSTYSVDNTSENKQAISLNGIIDISFYKEEIIYTQEFPTFDWNVYGITSTNPQPSTTIGKIYDGNSTLQQSGISASGNLFKSIGTSQQYLSCTTNNVGIGLTTPSSTLNITNTSNTSIDTGRIESGSISNTTFTQVDTKFESSKLGVIKYQILPSTSKPFSVDDIKTKTYCPKCGRKLKSDDNFCSSCGCKLK